MHPTLERMYVADEAPRWPRDFGPGAKVAGVVGGGCLLGGASVWLLPLDPIAMLAAGSVGATVGAIAVRVAQRFPHRRLEQLARGAIGRLRRRDGELVRVAGRVAAMDTLRGVFAPRLAVLRRLTFRVDAPTLVHEAAVDFDVVEPDGRRVRVDVGGALLRAPRPAGFVDTISDRLRDDVPGLGGWLAPDLHTRAHELLIGDGDEVAVVGLESWIPDPAGTGGSYREPPRRRALCSTHDVPLLILFRQGAAGGG